MKKILLALALWLTPLAAIAQCNGVFPANTLCGNLTGSPAPPSAFTASGTVVGPVSSVIGHFATWANITGSLLADFNLYAASNVWTGANNFTSTFQINGNTVTWPPFVGTIPFLGINQTWTGNNTFSTGTDNFTGTFQIGGVTVTLPISVPNGGTGNITATAHSLPINEGTSAQVNTGTGTTGQCLVSNGASADPGYIGGCRVLLATLTASSSATLSDTTHITSAYADYEIVLSNILPATNATICEINVHVSGVFQTTGYVSVTVGSAGGGTVNNTPTTYIPCGTGTTSSSSGGTPISCTIKLYAAAGTTAPKNLIGTCIGANSSAGVNLTTIGGSWNGSNAVVDGFQLQFSSGNIASGIVKIYGIL